MTYDDAIQFFYEHGNVGRSADDLKSKCPTVSQLSDAVDGAVLHGQSRSLAQEAGETILLHFCPGIPEHSRP